MAALEEESVHLVIRGSPKSCRQPSLCGLAEPTQVAWVKGEQDLASG